ncbi:PREDICTED: putative nuclease HARBI1 [Cyphomyrmex costatus]|uniref:putative nuclease HARBI1 n=1 Tax=Cyphomyrmex costatus TaxID=456900 RepID=UPI0008521F65|nr:PREDICTED: putative nuclease HARBI1 [Cyphomyrmex costatus]
MEAFERVSGFPNVIGAIDGTHVEIRSPQGDDHQAYINRKGYPSIHVQVVCTQNLLFTNIFAGNAGSVHDARVFRTSLVARYFENSEIYFPNDSHLVGDAAYGIHPNMMVPFKNNGHLSHRQKNFNFCQSSARIHIERLFGTWKGRWRSILDCLPMITLKKIPEYLVATAVLHNICILNKDLVDVNVVVNQHIQRNTLTSSKVDEGNRKRQRIMNNLIMRLV